MCWVCDSSVDNLNQGWWNAWFRVVVCDKWEDSVTEIVYIIEKIVMILVILRTIYKKNALWIDKVMHLENSTGIVLVIFVVVVKYHNKKKFQKALILIYCSRGNVHDGRLSVVSWEITSLTIQRTAEGELEVEWGNASSKPVPSNVLPSVLSPKAFIISPNSTTHRETHPNTWAYRGPFWFKSSQWWSNKFDRWKGTQVFYD